MDKGHVARNRSRRDSAPAGRVSPPEANIHVGLGRRRPFQDPIEWAFRRAAIRPQDRRAPHLGARRLYLPTTSTSS